MLSATDIERCQKRFGLTYHVGYAAEAVKLVGLKDKNILEIGGSLPDEFVRGELGARSWIGIEEMTYWNEVDTGEGALGTPPGRVTRPVAEAGPADIDRGYGVFSGRIEELPAALHGAFDVVFSIAAFEHIHNLALTLDGVHLALKPGGCLFTIFAPIWSSYCGHHLPRIKDRQGKVMEQVDTPIPPWGHLLMRPHEMFNHLLPHTDRATAAEIVYYVYHSPHINRLFAEDYLGYFQASRLKIEQATTVFFDKLPEGLQQRLEQLHPGRKHFANLGIRAILRKE